ncbi:lanthionine synthetase LanC family protein [Parachryseolinea silvisoli]|uniref:lanthionine synthetase LanC family protein n=1 Tax=Parachryseolinea silvisoli TaxID=2873601 RepID=UPI002265E49E|nr:lanthionine synthetase LanC family protein [Parachryseolinea silvisoli]MCD9019953.1 protein kinase [Parachryseolinea silvisoli]
MQVIKSKSVPRAISTDYRSMLRLQNTKFREADLYYLTIGTPKHQKGWIIHISVTSSQIPDALRVIIPYLLKEKTAFKVIRDLDSAQHLLDGKLGYEKIGKVVCVYPETDSIANKLAKHLILLTSPFKGPAVPTDTYLGGTVYTSYGNLLDEMPQEQTIALQKKAAKLTEFSQKKFPTFNYPAGIPWPFIGTPMPENKSLRILNNTYLIISDIKNAVKGSVYKTIQVKKWSIKLTVVKEARHEISIDKYNRDVADRLKWQYDLLTKLHGRISVPEPYELFQESGNSYLAMQYIKGRSLDKVIKDTFDGGNWSTLKTSQKKYLLRILLDVFEVVNKLHNLGYVHRDITPVNFMINKKGQIILIDLEGTHPTSNNHPSSPFSLGTPGYTAPEQLESEVVSKSQDIYSIGALMFVFFSSLKPIKFLHPVTIIKTKLDNLDIPEPIELIIQKCLDTNPIYRPNLSDITNIIQKYLDDLSPISHNAPSVASKNIHKDEIKEIITKGLNFFDSDLSTNLQRLWTTDGSNETTRVINKTNNINTHPSLFNGVGGGLYIISDALSAGFEIPHLNKTFKANYSFLKNQIGQTKTKYGSGLYYGTSGIGLCLTKCVKLNILSNTPDIQKTIANCFNNNNESDLSLSTGISGQCLAISHYLSIFQDNEMENMLVNKIERVFDLQKKDGSWNLNGHTTYTGIEGGISGIILSILSSIKYISTTRAIDSIKRALSWIDSQTAKKDGIRLWTINDKTNDVDPWFNIGISGIALCYIYCYRLIKDDDILKSANSVLTYLSRHLQQNSLSLSNGICGLGEVYLEAQRLLGNNIYKEEIESITKLVLAARQEHKSAAYWISSDENNPHISLMSGTGGVLHYLLKYYKPDSIPFPLLNTMPI